MVDRAVCAVLAGLAILPAARGYAQEARAETVARLKTGTILRVEMLALGRIDGRLAGTVGDTLVLRNEGSQSRIALPDVQSLWERGRAWKTGAIIGGITGGTGLAILAGVVCGGVDRGCDSGERSAAVLVGGAVGLAGGALVGGLIGAAIPKWHRRYP
jgi:hypothetical protein